MAKRQSVARKPSPSRELPASAPKKLSRIEFGRKLSQILLERGWTQSDLARQAFGETRDSRGYKVPKNREIISGIINGKSFPSPLNLRRVAHALGMKDDELLPDPIKAIDQEEAAAELEFKIAAGHSNEGWLRISRLVTYDTFIKIAALLQLDKAGK